MVKCVVLKTEFMHSTPLYCLNSRIQTQVKTSSCATPRSWRTAICPRSRASASRTSTETLWSPLMWWVPLSPLLLLLNTWTFKASMLNIFNQCRPLLFNKPLDHRTLLCRNNSVTHARKHTHSHTRTHAHTQALFFELVPVSGRAADQTPEDCSDLMLSLGWTQPLRSRPTILSFQVGWILIIPLGFRRPAVHL